TRAPALRVSSLSFHPPPPDYHTLSLHDALPILRPRQPQDGHDGQEPADRRQLRGAVQALPGVEADLAGVGRRSGRQRGVPQRPRSEEHTSELQSQSNLVCRLLLEKKKSTQTKPF